MIKALAFFLGLVLASFYLTNLIVYAPLHLLAFLQWIFGYIPLAIGVIVLIWFFGK